MPPTLIDVSTLPGDDMSPEAIRGGARSLRAAADKAFTDSADVVKTWSGIAHSYEAPESGELVAAMTPVKTSGATLDRNLCSAADALDTFAEAVRAVKKACDGIRAQGNALRAMVDANGRVGAVGPFPGSAWYHDPVTSGRNDALIAAVSEQAALLKTAERACAGALEGLAGGGQHGEHGGPGFATAPTVENPSWGHVTTRQDVLDVEGPGQTEGVAQQGLQTLAGFVSLVGFDTSRYQVVDGKPQGQLFGHWSVHNIVVNLEGIGQAFAHPIKTFEAMGKDLTAWDDWDDRPGFAFGRVLVNAGLIGASFLKVGSLARVGSAGREAVDAAGAGSKAASEAEQAAARAGRLARTVEIGQRAGQKVVVATVDGLKELAKATKADRVWKSTIDRLEKAVTALRRDIDVDRPNAPEHVEPVARDLPGDGAPVHDTGHAGNHQPTPGHDQPDAGSHHGGRDSGSADHRDDPHHEPQGQHRFPENSTDVNPHRLVVHDRNKFELEHAQLGPNLPDARPSLQKDHLDALHKRNALAKLEHVDPKDLTVDKRARTFKLLRNQATTPDDLHRLRELRAATVDEYDTARRLHRVSERMGTDAGKAFHESREETLIAGDHDRPGRRDELDTVGINKARTVFNVMEEKGGTAGPGGRNLETGVRAQQGSTAYLNEMLHTDAEVLDHFKRNPDDVRRLIRGDMELQYHMLYAKPDGTVWVDRVKLNPDELHLEDLLPPPASVPAPVLPAPVPAPR